MTPTLSKRKNNIRNQHLSVEPNCVTDDLQIYVKDNSFDDVLNCKEEDENSSGIHGGKKLNNSTKLQKKKKKILKVTGGQKKFLEHSVEKTDTDANQDYLTHSVKTLFSDLSFTKDNSNVLYEKKWWVGNFEKFGDMANEVVGSVVSQFETKLEVHFSKNVWLK